MHTRLGGSTMKKDEAVAKGLRVAEVEPLCIKEGGFLRQYHLSRDVMEMKMKAMHVTWEKHSR